MRPDYVYAALACTLLILAGAALAHTGHIVAHHIGMAARVRTVGGLL